MLRNQRRRALEGQVHLARMVQNPPRVDHVEAAQRSRVVGVQNRAPLDGPLLITGREALGKRLGAGHRLRVVVEGPDAGAKPSAFAGRGWRETALLVDGLVNGLVNGRAAQTRIGIST